MKVEKGVRGVGVPPLCKHDLADGVGDMGGGVGGLPGHTVSHKLPIVTID